MSKLFALEELDTAVDAGELEAAPEVGEVADVQVEVEQELGETAEATDAIEEGIGAADQLEQVETVVADAVENGEGLDPVAAEAIRIAVEAICARVGANPKAVYSLYATENFQSASSRKANSKIALEGVGEFLKDLWKKIKGALTRLWEKAKAFWDKHISSLGRAKKALESMKAKVSESSGKIKDKAYIDEAPSSLVDAFPGNGDLSSASIGKYITAHRKVTDGSQKFSDEIATMNAAAEAAGQKVSIAAVTALVNMASDKTLTMGEKSAPMVGGVYVTYTVKGDATEGTIDFEVERETIDDKESKVGVSISDKAAIQELLKATLTIVADTVKVKEKQSKMDAAFSKLMLNIEKAVNGAADKLSPEDSKAMRNLIKIVYKINAKGPGINAELLGLNLKLVKGVLGYSALCLKNYK